MRIGKLVAVVAALIGGIAAFGATPSLAAPIGPGAVTGVRGGAPVETVQYYHYRPAPVYRERRVIYRDRPVYHRRPVYGRPVYGRPVYGRPVYGRPVYGRPVYGYRPVRRVVCTTRIRLIPTSYGYVRRPVRVCTRR
jgi:hypothetical protein